MPTITVKRDRLFNLIGKRFSDEEFDELCFQFGIELDEVTSERTMLLKETGRESLDASEEVVYKIEIPANRYDLLSVEGLSLALRVFLGLDKAPTFTTLPAKERITVSKEVAAVRPYVVCAILRDVHFDESSYDSFIDLQEKLHQNICRKRALVSMGTHDLDTIEGPFHYTAKRPEDIAFAPLNRERTMDGHELMRELKNDLHLGQYLHLIMSSPVYPVIYDSKGVVLSLPPIINGNHSKITLKTKNVFIEVTATDLTKAQIVLNTLVCTFSQYSSRPFSVEQVMTSDSEGKEISYPDLSGRLETVTVGYLNSRIGVTLTAKEIVPLLHKMGFSATANDEEDISVLVPASRSDVLHACDIMEDVAISFGFNNLVPHVPSTISVGKQQPLNKFTDLLRWEVALAGFSELLTLCLCSTQENFVFLNRKEDDSAVVLANPKSEEYQVGRTTLLVGLLKSLSNNKDMPLPLKVFEISDVLLKDPHSDVGARNNRRLCAVNLNTTPGFEVVHGLLDLVMAKLDIRRDPKLGYDLNASSDPMFLLGQQASIYFKCKRIGSIGVLHPQVLKNFDIGYPCSALELEIEPLLASRRD